MWLDGRTPEQALGKLRAATLPTHKAEVWNRCRNALLAYTLPLPHHHESKRCIPANPDISGIGVRAAMYAQNLLSFSL
jgi:hypothetical protein